MLYSIKPRWFIPPSFFFVVAFSSVLIERDTASAQFLENSENSELADVIIYGGTSAGIAAAIQVKRMGKSVILIEPFDNLGGLTTGGLGQTDIGNKAAIGGISREFYRRVRQYYRQPEAWKWQQAEDYRSVGQSRTSADEDTMWTFEPHVALKIYQDWLAEMEIDVVSNERLDREGGVAMTRSIPWRILSWYELLLRNFEAGENLLVPVCLSATHIAFGSIRMEPVFMVLGQSAATAAVHAIDQQVPVQGIDYPELRQRLLEDQAILQWKEK